MKIQPIKNISTVLLLLTTIVLRAQVKQPETLPIGAIAPYAIEVTYDKTSHIIFPAGIRYVDLGSDYIIAGKVEDAGNVLRVKAAAKGFTQETNFSVITEDGNFYGFNACYSEAPEVMSYNLVRGQTLSDRAKSADVQFEELGQTPAFVSGLLMKTLYEKDRHRVKNIKSGSYGITFSFKGIYVHEGKYYFHTQVENETYVPFKVDFVKFRIADRKVAKRTVIQERALIPLRAYRPLLPVTGHTTDNNIFLLDVFTLAEGQLLYIEIFEKDGGR